MEIIASGCSFTAGDELVELVPNYLNSGPDEELYKQYNKQVGYIRNDMIKWKELLNQQRQLAWPAKLQELDDTLEVQNVAQGGLSIEEICWRVLKQINRNFRKPDCVIIMLTAPSRFGHAIHSELTEYNFRSYLLTSNTWLQNNQLHKLITEPDNYDHLWRTYNVVTGTKKLLESRGIKCIIVDSGMCASTVDTSKKRDNELYDLLDVKINFGQFLIDYNDEYQTRLPGCHPTEIMHEMFAKEVYKCMMSYM